MNILIDDETFKNSKANDKIPLKCEHCGEIFYVLKKHIIYWNKKTPNNCFLFCSRKCENLHKNLILIKNCLNCGKEKIIKKSENLRSKNGHFFCCSSCAATYNNLHKTTGTRRSKLEIHIENILLEKYPDLIILFNDKKEIKSELDIYIPSLKLAFELNGIYHYEPIHGYDKYNKIINNDNNKFQLCQKKSISLCVIDTSSQKHFKKETSQKFIDLITNIIDNEISYRQ